MTTRALTDESGYTCDWGGCNDVAVFERRSPEHGWLPVCDRHKGPRPRGPATTRGGCRDCGKEYALTADGRLPLHRDGWVTCPGARKPPRSDQGVREVGA